MPDELNLQPTQTESKSQRDSTPKKQGESELQPSSGDGNKQQKKGDSQKSQASKKTETKINIEEFKDNPFEVPENRRLFIQRVFLIVTAMLFIATALSCLPFVWIRFRIYNHYHWWPYLLAGVAFMGMYFLIACIPWIRHQVPINYICLFLYAIITGFLLACMASFHSAFSFTIAAAMTTILCVALVLYATFTKTDFTGCGIFIFAIGIVLMMSTVVMFLAFFLFPEYLPIIHTIVCCIVVLAHSFLLIVNIQRVLGNKKNKLQLNEYAAGALYIFTDIIQIFMGMLGLSR